MSGRGDWRETPRKRVEYGQDAEEEGEGNTSRRDEEAAAPGPGRGGVARRPGFFLQDPRRRGQAGLLMPHVGTEGRGAAAGCPPQKTGSPGPQWSDQLSGSLLSLVLPGLPSPLCICLRSVLKLPRC